MEPLVQHEARALRLRQQALADGVHAILAGVDITRGVQTWVASYTNLIPLMYVV